MASFWGLFGNQRGSSARESKREAFRVHHRASDMGQVDRAGSTAAVSSGRDA
jgi:hypothetical protein